MVLLMFIKWVTYESTATGNGAFCFLTSNFFLAHPVWETLHYFCLFYVDPKLLPTCAPSILITFINMVLFKPAEPSVTCDPYMYAGQGGLQKLLVVIALLCVPWMLLAKPLYIMRNQRKAHLPVSVLYINYFCPVWIFPSIVLVSIAVKQPRQCRWGKWRCSSCWFRKWCSECCSCSATSPQASWRTWRRGSTGNFHPFRHPYYRVCFGICVAHSFLPPFVGAVFGPCS